MKFNNVEKRLTKDNKVGCYTYIDDNGVLWSVPEDENNTHYIKMMKQHKEGKIVIVEKNSDGVVIADNADVVDVKNVDVSPIGDV